MTRRAKALAVRAITKMAKVAAAKVLVVKAMTKKAKAVAAKVPVVKLTTRKAKAAAVSPAKQISVNATEKPAQVAGFFLLDWPVWKKE
jgi:glyceraldehyde-3-phosphate dehydrogenase/erythrose-4-phosphate dehydrogenase